MEKHWSGYILQFYSSGKAKFNTIMNEISEIEKSNFPAYKVNDNQNSRTGGG